MDNTNNQSHNTTDEDLSKNNATIYMNQATTYERNIFTTKPHAPVSLRPENQLSTYLWPLPRATDSWGYGENKYVEWKRWNILQEILGEPTHEPQIDTSYYDSSE
jgi:hypothetical protein